MIGPVALESLGINVLAQVAILAAAIAYAFAGVYGRRFRKLGVSPLATATGQVTASSLVLVPFALVLDQPFALSMPGMATLAALVALALVSTAFAYILYFRVLATAGATNVVLVTLLIPVSAVLLGAVVLGERLEPRHALGMGLIAIGLALIDGRPVRALARRMAA
jgi:drug/metabolite transporter (DMT)-like permease